MSKVVAYDFSLIFLYLILAEKDLVLLGICRTVMNRSTMTVGSHRKSQTVRSRTRSAFYVEGQQVGRDASLFVMEQLIGHGLTGR